MFLSQINLKPVNQFEVQELIAWSSSNSYSVHKKIWKWFEEDGVSNRDFLYRIEKGAQHYRVWTLSKRLPNILDNYWICKTKEMSLNLSKGDILEFSIRLNPVVQRLGKIHDVIMDAKKNSDDPINREQIILHWLQKRESIWGVKFGKEIFINEYSVESFRKKKYPVSIATVDIKGVLKIEDADLFVEQYFKGFGRAKGFGCGFMLIRRI